MRQRRTRWALAVVAAAAAVAAGYVAMNRVEAAAGVAPLLAGAPATAQVLSRGKYLTEAADCAACHTVPGSAQPYAGGVAFRLPIGTLYSSNITADADSGIGRWSDEDFVAAVRDGVGKDGAHLYPAFPYTSYTLLSRTDVLAIKAYLLSQPAIHRANRPADLWFPFNQRWAMGFWNAAFFKSERFARDPSKSPEWNSGAYLASALGHCGECHTPRNLGYGLQHGAQFAGQELQGWRAYNITADARAGIGAWSDGALADYLRTGRAAGHASASGPMGEVVANSLQYLDPADIAALVVYLRSVPAKTGNEPVQIDPRPAPLAASSAVAPGGDDPGWQGAGGRLFAGNCASCHRWDGAGLETPYAALTGARSVHDPRGVNVTQVILQGVNLRLGDSLVYMPSFGRAFSDTEIAELSNYVVAHFGGGAGTVTPRQVGERRAL